MGSEDRERFRRGRVGASAPERDGWNFVGVFLAPARIFSPIAAGSSGAGAPRRIRVSRMHRGGLLRRLVSVRAADDATGMAEMIDVVNVGAVFAFHKVEAPPRVTVR